MNKQTSKSASGKTESENLLHKVLYEVTAIYVFLMLVVYPLYYQNKYYNIGNAKWNFFSILTFGAGIILITASFIHFIVLLHRHEFVKAFGKLQFSVTDRFVFLYFVCVLISTLLSPYKNLVIWGSQGWHMGMVAQICFVIIYYFVSRYWKWDKSAVILCLVTAFIVFLLAVLMRFRIDPLNMYKDLDEQYVVNFLSTIGQITWYSSYVVLLLPLGIFAFWFYDQKLLRLLTGIFISVGFMTIVTQNSDSMFIAHGLLIFSLFWISLESNKKFERFLEVLFLCLASFKFMGICQQAFPQAAVPLDPLSLFCSQSRLTWFLLILILILYFVFRRLQQTIDISRVKSIRVLFLLLISTACLLAIVYICLNTAGRLPEKLKSNNHYLFFDEYWGNNRGSSWMIAVNSWLKGNIFYKIWGCGPDGFSLYVKSFFGEELAQKWGRSIALTCAHNEWLNALVNLGLAGAASYMGIFISAVIRFFKKSSEHPVLNALAISVLCYMGHNFFCYQQVVCTPIVFILIGAGESVIRSNTMQNQFSPAPKHRRAL